MSCLPGWSVSVAKPRKNEGPVALHAQGRTSLHGKWHEWRGHLGQIGEGSSGRCMTPS